MSEALQSLFDPPAERRSTVKVSNYSQQPPQFEEEESTAANNYYYYQYDEQTPLLSNKKTTASSSRHHGVSSTTTTTGSTSSSIPLAPVLEEEVRPITPQHHHHSFQDNLLSWGRSLGERSTWMGAALFVLYHVVFSLTLASSCIPSQSQSQYHHHHHLGVMTQMATLGILCGAFVYWIQLGTDLPALYPTVDLFVAPFLAHLAQRVEQHVTTDVDENKDAVFLASFTVLVVIAVWGSAFLILLASIFKVANLGSSLPFPVICGFFAAVGVLTYSLAFQIDSNGHSISECVQNPLLFRSALIHHIPTLLLAIAMKWLGPKNPVFVVACLVTFVLLFYTFMMGVYGATMQDMIQAGWFWSKTELIGDDNNDSSNSATTQGWAPPAPLGWMHEVISTNHHVHWGAVYEGLGIAFALSFLYTIRCTLHGAALKKNVPNLHRLEYSSSTTTTTESSSSVSSPGHRRRPSAFQAFMNRARKFSEVIDIENVFDLEDNHSTGSAAAGSEENKPIRVYAKPSQLSLKDILFSYGCSQLICGLVGGPPIVPSVAAAPTMYTLGAEKVAPQLCSVLFLLLFYLTSFEMVSYIPKPAFSSLLVLAFIDMMWTWLIKSYFKTRSKIEWLVVPAIVIFAEVFGLLNAVFLGIAMSTLIFIASFYRSGVVKYVSNGINIRSTIERPPAFANWLDNNGELIQVLVLQNYLFFGNASSIQSYILSMFEEPEEPVDPVLLPPIPKIVVMDMSLVTGIDTSAVDVFAEILSTVTHHDCKLYLSGISNSHRQVMYLGGVKPESTRDRSKRKLRFFSNLDAAIGKAEDFLLEDHNMEEHFQKRSMKDRGLSGFEAALRHIEEQHDTSAFTAELLELKDDVTAITVAAGEVLYRTNTNRGLYFIEEGIMKIERDATMTLSRTNSADGSSWTTGVPPSPPSSSHPLNNNNSLNSMKARTPGIARELSRLKQLKKNQASMTSFRVARMGPGWIVGSLDAVTTLSRGGATDRGSGLSFSSSSLDNLVAVTKCRLHYLSYEQMSALESSRPSLMLKLHKLLALLNAKRQSLTIHQLATLHSIMSSSPQQLHQPPNPK